MRVKDALSKANITTVEGMEKKKTIAQILDEALEQEFPEEKVEHIGKDYNETAKQEDVSFLYVSILLVSCRLIFTYTRGPIDTIKEDAFHS